MMKYQLKNSAQGFWMGTLLALSVAALLGAGCASVPETRIVPPENVATSSAVAEINNAIASAALIDPGSSADYHLGPEDLLQIIIFNVPEREAGVTPRKAEVPISQVGKITLPLLGDVVAAWLTPSALEQSLRSQYGKYIHNPQIGVYVREYRGQQVSVMGAVRTPGVYQLTGPKTLVDVFSMAGRITERAGGQVHLYRQGPEGRQSQVIDLLILAGNPELVNMPVRAGDVINVPQAGMFFVDGAVGSPGSYTLNRPYTLTQALAVAGGVTRTLASYSDISIFRRRDGLEAEKIPVDLGEILAGKQGDPQIEADDVIVVPISTAKYIVERFLGRIGLGSIPGFIL
jgi:polysaccharide biosynthesis/export protein